MILLLLFLLVSPAKAQDDGYLKIKKVKRQVRVVEDADLTDGTREQLERVAKLLDQNPPQELPPFPQPNPTQGLDIVSTFVKVWDIVKENRPVVGMDTDKFATALPEIAYTDWKAVGGWKPERNILVSTSYINLYGWEVVRFDYQVKLLFGGNVRGRGLYIASARIVPTKVDVAWGYTLNVVASAPTVLNIRTPENPLAMIQLVIKYTIATILKEDTTTDTYQVQGDGKIVDTKKNKVLLSPVLRLH